MMELRQRLCRVDGKSRICARKQRCNPYESQKPERSLRIRTTEHEVAANPLSESARRDWRGGSNRLLLTSPYIHIRLITPPRARGFAEGVPSNVARGQHAIIP